jgi:hypothetical protein
MAGVPRWRGRPSVKTGKNNAPVLWLLNQEAANSCSCRRFVLHQFQAKTLPPLHAGDLDVYDGLGWPLLDFHAFLNRAEDHHVSYFATQGLTKES